MSEKNTPHAITRIRREPVRRALTVAAIERQSPHMLRIRFESPELAGFESAAPDDHIKLFVPEPFAPPGERCMRDYTPRAFDAAAGTLVIDFALHETGPATRWALAAKPGDQIHIGGPRGSTVVVDDFDWYLLIGDETALPAIARRIEELRPAVPVTVIAIVDGDEDRLALPERERLDIVWVTRAGRGSGDDALVISSLETRSLPLGEGYVWIAAEASVARALRDHVIDRLGHPKSLTKASGYWSAGEAGAHTTLND